MSAFSAAGQFHIYPGAADLLVPVCRLCRLSDRIAAGTGLYQRTGGRFCRHPVSVRNRRPASSGRLGGPAPCHPPQMDPQCLLRPGTGRQRRLLFHPARLLGDSCHICRSGRSGAQRLSPSGLYGSPVHQRRNGCQLQSGTGPWVLRLCCLPMPRCWCC